MEKSVYLVDGDVEAVVVDAVGDDVDVEEEAVEAVVVAVDVVTVEVVGDGVADAGTTKPLEQTATLIYVPLQNRIY